MSIVTWPGPDTPRDRVHRDQQPIRMCDWIAHLLTWALNHGWRQLYPVTSGWRPGPDSHTSTGVSNHQGTDWNGGQTPCGAIDFGGYTSPEGKATKLALIALAKRKRYTWRGLHRHNLVAPIGFDDDGHCSGNGH